MIGVLQAQESAKKCEYNSKNQLFTDAKGNKVQIHFARHALASSVFNFWQEMTTAVDNKIKSLKIARKLIEINSEQSADMLQYSNYILSQLKANNLSWVGIENSQKYIQSYGVVERCIASETNANTFKNYGLSDGEVDLLMVNLEGSDGYAYCRWVNSFSAADSKVSHIKTTTSIEAVRKVKLIGIDNERLQAMDDLQIKINDYQKKAEKTLNSSHKKILLVEIEALYSQKDILMKKEMKLRDSGIARDLLRAAETYSNSEKFGIVVLGSFHEKGVLKELVENCK